MPTVTDLNLDPLTETFLDVEEVLWRTCLHVYRKYNFECRKNGYDLEELQSEALLQFMHAYRTYDTTREDRRSFASWVAFRVGICLLEKIRQGVFHHNRLPRVEVDLERRSVETKFHLCDLLDELSEDAQTVVKLALDPPPDVTLAAHERRDPGKHAKDRDLKMRELVQGSIIEFLQDVGWGRRRIRRSFKEIRKVLT